MSYPALIFIKSLYCRVIQVQKHFISEGFSLTNPHVLEVWGSTVNLKNLLTVPFNVLASWQMLAFIDFSPPAPAYAHVNIVHFSVEKLIFKTEDISVSTGEAPSFSTSIRWYTFFIVAEPLLCLHHPRHASCPLYAICFAHCVHIYIDVMHIFIHVQHPWALYFVNTQKDVYKYCMPLCVNKIWCTVNALEVLIHHSNKYISMSI